MKKDIEWLVKMINSEQETIRQRFESGRGTPNETTFNEGRDWALRHVLRMMHNMDEPEVLTRELPVIPKYVADWWERDDDSVTLYGGLQVKKKHKFGLISKFHDKGLGDYLLRVEDWLDENDSAFLDLVNGKPYEVEEEPLYYALIKGHELIAGEDACKYWKCDMRNGSMFLSNRYSHYGRYLAEMTENDWGKFGINESNADFVKAGE